MRQPWARLAQAARRTRALIASSRQARKLPTPGLAAQCAATPCWLHGAHTTHTRTRTQCFASLHGSPCRRLSCGPRKALQLLRYDLWERPQDACHACRQGVLLQLSKLLRGADSDVREAALHVVARMAVIVEAQPLLREVSTWQSGWVRMHCGGSLVDTACISGPVFLADCGSKPLPHSRQARCHIHSAVNSANL